METSVAKRTSRASGTRGAGGLQNVAGLRISALGAACALAAIATGAALAGQGAPVDDSVSSGALHQDAAPASVGDAKSDFLADIEVRKSHSIAPSEIVGFDLMLNEFNLNEVNLSEVNLSELNSTEPDPNESNRHFTGDEYKSNFSSVSPSRRSSWRADYDPLTANQLSHAYQWTVVEGFRPPVESSRLDKDSEARR
jgi:hypothetical protein